MGGELLSGQKTCSEKSTDQLMQTDSVRRDRLANLSMTVEATTHRLRTVRTGQGGSHSLQLNTAREKDRLESQQPNRIQSSPR